MLARRREKTARGVREGRAEGGPAMGGMGDVRGVHRFVSFRCSPKIDMSVEKRSLFFISRRASCVSRVSCFRPFVVACAICVKAF